MSIFARLEASPKHILAGIFLFGLLSIVATELHPSLFYRNFTTGFYVMLHNNIEFFTVIVSISIFGLGWYAYPQSGDRRALFLSCTFLMIGLLDLMHALSYTTMPDFITQNSENKEGLFRLAARFLSGVAFLASAYMYQAQGSKWQSKKLLLATALAISSITFVGVVYYEPYLPAVEIEHKGLTPFRIYASYLTIALFAAAYLAYWKRYSKDRDQSLLWLLAGLILSIFGEIGLTLFKTEFDTYNFLGHIYKLTAFFMFYRGLFISSIQRPYLKVDSYNKLLKNAYYKLSGFDKLKDNFIRVSMHEMKTPLVPILGYSEILKNSKGLTKEQRKYAEMIYNNSLRAVNLSKKLFDISKVRTSSLTMSLEKEDPLRIIAEVYKEKRQYAQAKKVAMAMNVQKGMPKIIVDRKNIVTVLGNLVDNALKFTDKKGEIEIGAEYRQGTNEAAFWVKDTGIGIKKNEIRKIFGEFYQVDSSLSRNFEGAGVGLAICKGIVEAHGGKIWAESEYGKGAKFIFTIPASGNP